MANWRRGTGTLGSVPPILNYGEFLIKGDTIFLGNRTLLPGIVSSIGQIAITVEQLPRAVAFYRDLLGLRFLFETGEMAFFDCGGVRLMLTRAEKPDSTYGSIIYYQTENIHEAVEKLEKLKVRFEATPRMIAKTPESELWMAFFHDSEGNLLALMSEVGTAEIKPAELKPAELKPAELKPV
jgi:methylmalonyl-CoA/ethylmalonyl-CoA epimerase